LMSGALSTDPCGLYCLCLLEKLPWSYDRQLQINLVGRNEMNLQDARGL
jgi:hypothetical protein